MLELSPAPLSATRDSFQVPALRTGGSSTWEEAFQSLLEKAKGSLRDVALYGIKKARDLISEGEEEKRKFELTGEFRSQRL